MAGRIGIRWRAALAGAVLGLFGLVPGSAPGPAFARTSVFIGIGPVLPIHPHHRHHHHHYPPPPIHVAPPPVVLYPAPPPVIFAEPSWTAPPPVPMTVNPAGPEYRARNGQLCREYQTTIVIGGVRQPGFGTACQQADGSWRVVN